MVDQFLADFSQHPWDLLIYCGDSGWICVGAVPDRASAQMQIEALRRLLPSSRFAFSCQPQVEVSP